MPVSVAAAVPSIPGRAPGRRLLQAGLLTAVVDGLFACVLHVAAFGSTVARLWQGVASVVIGREAFEGGGATVALGLLLHFGVAFAWSAVFLFLVSRWAWVRRLLGSRHGVAKVAALYGPFVWLVMSLVVIPAFTGRPPALGARWWVQVLGHAPFVGLPIVWSSVRPLPLRS
jgi:hypothetical protein